MKMYLKRQQIKLVTRREKQLDQIICPLSFHKFNTLACSSLLQTSSLNNQDNNSNRCLSPDSLNLTRFILSTKHLSKKKSWIEAGEPPKSSFRC